MTTDTHRMRAAAIRSGARAATGRVGLLPSETASPVSQGHRDDATGWVARLELGYESRAGRTVVARRSQMGPLAVQKALYPETGAICQSVVLHPPAGIAGGDQLDLSVSVDVDAHAQLVTPGAARWYRSAGARARQRVVFALGAGAKAEWLPQENIVFDGAIAETELCVELAAGAAWIGWEIFCLGRTSAGERFERGVLRQRTQISRDSVPQWLERGVVHSASRLRTAAPCLHGRSVFGTLLAAAEHVPEALLRSCREIRCVVGELGITKVPGVLAVRYLGNSTEEARQCFAGVWSKLRPPLLGRDAVAPRIWST